MAGKFEVYRDKSGEFRFRLKAANGKVILASEGYSSKSGALGGIESVKKNAGNPERFEKVQSGSGKFVFRLKAANGQIIGQSQVYSSSSSATRGRSAVERGSKFARIVEKEDGGTGSTGPKVSG